jgi:hypothetical protein
MELSIMCESSFSELLVGTYMLHAEDMQNLSKVFTHWFLIYPEWSS